MCFYLHEFQLHELVHQRNSRANGDPTVIQGNFEREEETLLAPQGTSNASSREIYPKSYVNSITAINTGENQSLSRYARVTYECIRNNLFM